VFETEEELIVRAEIPGLRGEDLRVRIDGEVLHISGVRTVPKEPGVRRLHRMEIAFGPFERTVRVQVPFERERVSAHLEDGFLRVVLPKKKSAPRQVDIEVDVEAT
jgi:HSP20 family protein